MWPTIDRARRRISGGASTPGSVSPLEGSSLNALGPVAPMPATRRVEDVVIILVGLELDQLGTALQQLLGETAERPDTPARIEHALSMLIAHRGAPGRPRVVRRPAGLSTPESWEIHLERVDRATGDAIRDACRTGMFAC